MYEPAAHETVRVVFIDHTAELGGAELALLRLAEGLPDEVEPLVLLFSDGPLRAALDELGIPVEVVPLDRGVSTVNREAALRLSWANLRLLPRAVRFSRDLTRHLRLLRPDVVYTNSLKSHLICLLPAKIAGIPLVWHVHDRIAPDYLPRPLVHLVRLLSWLPDAVIVNSEATGHTLPRHDAVAYPGFAPSQVRLDAPDHAGEEGPVIGLIGRIGPTKGQLEFVRAARPVLDRFPAATFRLVGSVMFDSQEYAASVREEADRLGLGDRLQWRGFVDDPAAELDQLSVCVHASPVPEPFGQVVVEAMIRGVPLVATRGGGVEEIVVTPEGTLGTLVPPGDAPALAAAICEILRDPDIAAQRATRARDSALQRFPISRTVEVVTDVLRRTAGPVRSRLPSARPDAPR